jgi:hypothetical protein
MPSRPTPPRRPVASSGTGTTASDDELALRAAELARLLLERAGAPPSGEDPAALTAEVGELRAEVERLRALVGPDETSYVQLRTDLWGARDAAIGAEMEAGQLRGRVTALENELLRAQRNHRLLTHKVIAPLRRAKRLLRRL